MVRTDGKVGRRVRPRGWVSLCSGASRALMIWLALSASAVAQDPAPLGLEEATRLLQSRQPDEARLAIESLGLIGTPQIIEPLSERIRCGLPRPLLMIAIETLEVVGDPAAGDVLETLARHRGRDVRATAMRALATTRPPGARDLLVEGLSDRHSKVRTAAARALGEMGAENALEPLVHAMDRGVVGAAASVGKLVPPGQVERLTSRLGKQPFASLSPGLVAVVERDDVAHDTKLELVAELREMGTREAARFLRAIVSSIGDRTDPLRQAAERAASQIAE